MDWKSEVTACLDQADDQRLINLAEQSLNKVLRYVQMNIWGDDRLLRRWRAVDALGKLTEKFAKAHDEVFRNLLRRCLWAMNDESGNVPWAAPEVMAAIIAARPEQFAEFIPMLVTNALDNPICNKGLAWAAAHLAAEQGQALTPFLPKLYQLLEAADSDTQGCAVEAFGLLSDDKARAIIASKTEDQTMCRHYHDGAWQEHTIGQLAVWALASGDNSDKNGGNG